MRMDYPGCPYEGDELDIMDAVISSRTEGIPGLELEISVVFHTYFEDGCAQG